MLGELAPHQVEAPHFKAPGVLHVGNELVQPTKDPTTPLLVGTTEREVRVKGAVLPLEAAGGQCPLEVLFEATQHGRGVYSHPNDSRASDSWERAEASHLNLEGVGSSRHLRQHRFQTLETVRVDLAQKLQRYVEIVRLHPTDGISSCRRRRALRKIFSLSFLGRFKATKKRISETSPDG